VSIRKRNDVEPIWIGLFEPIYFHKHL